MAHIKHVRDKNNLLVSEAQHHSNSLQKGTKTEYQLFPTQSTAAFNSFFTIDVKPQGKHLESLTLNFLTGGLSGITGSGTDNYVLPCAFWISRMDIVISDKVADTIPGEVFWYLHNLFSLNDEERSYQNLAMGDYTTTSRLNTLTTTSGSEWFVELFSIFKQSHIPIISNNHNVQLRIYTRSVTDCYVAGSNSGTAALTITTAYCIGKLSQMSQSELSTYQSQLAKLPRHIRFNDVAYQIITQASGVSTANYTLTAFGGKKVETIIFVVRSSGATGSSLISYTALKDFDFVDSGGQSLTGGSVITSARSLKHLGRNFTNTTFLIGSASVNNVYVWSFSTHPLHSIQTGISNGDHYFQGSEQLKINFTSSLSSAVEIFIFSLNSSAIMITPLTIEKINL